MEAADNVRYLAMLERFLSPLYSAVPAALTELLPALFRTVGIIGGISRFFNSPQRLGGLLAKVSLQLLVDCSRYVSIEESWWASGWPCKYVVVDGVLLGAGLHHVAHA